MVFFFIILGALVRILSHFHFFPYIPNFAPIAAMALFGGTYLNKKYALIVPIVALFLGDIFIGFYSPWIMISVYGSFLLIGLIGLWLKKHKKLPIVLGATLTASILFFIITNFAVWMVPHSFYPHTWQGIISCYTMALPFFKNTILGDLFYVSAMFGLTELVYKITSVWQLKRRGNGFVFERVSRK